MRLEFTVKHIVEYQTEHVPEIVEDLEYAQQQTATRRFEQKQTILRRFGVDIEQYEIDTEWLKVEAWTENKDEMKTVHEINGLLKQLGLQ